jgi:hypothetical protein
MIRRIDAATALDQIIAGDPNPIVAEFVIYDDITLLIPEHAINSYATWLKRQKRSRSISKDRDELMSDLHDCLSASFIAKREDKTKPNIVFRFWKGFIFVLEWAVTTHSWLLKTAYRVFTPRKRGFTIKPAKKDQLASTWSPSYSF